MIHCYTWKPKPDITLHELAIVMPYLQGVTSLAISKVEFSILPETVKRHFEPQEDDSLSSDYKINRDWFW